MLTNQSRQTATRFCVSIAALFVLCLPTLASKTPAAPALSSYVNPFVGTDSGGNTFPGAVAPFGMMQLSPNLKGNGYYYADTHMHGFVLNLMSGDGCDDEGQVLMTATTGPVKIDRDSPDYTFDHQHETASAGYYQVFMQPWNINAEMTTTTRCGMLKLTYPAGKQSNVILPLSYANNAIIASHVHFVDNQTVTGDVTSQAFLGEPKGITVYFVMAFSKPFDTHGVWSGTALEDGQSDAAQNDKNSPVIGFYGSYPASAKPQEVDVRIGMSYVDEAGAIANLKAEMPKGTFAHYRDEAAKAWDRELSVIDVQGGTLAHNRIFYTALYHALIAPTIFDDVDGRYRGFDDKIYQVPTDHKHLYATFSGWDIYRTEIPLLTIIEPQRVRDMAQSIVEMSKQLGYIDRWP
jgi:predicted alpha-1,2-mannosidase